MDPKKMSRAEAKAKVFRTRISIEQANAKQLDAHNTPFAQLILKRESFDLTLRPKKQNEKKQPPFDETPRFKIS